MIGCHSWGTMNLTWAVKYAVQAGAAHVLKCLLPLNGVRAAGSCIDGRVLGIILRLGALIFVAPSFADAVPGC